MNGDGVRVALIDTGISPVADLAGRIVPVAHPLQAWRTADCVDLSGEGTCVDGYGHGTFMAGLVAGTGAASGGAYRGVAPGARIVSVKISGRDGATDVSKLLAALQWVVSFKDVYRIRVVNLSVGTDSATSYRHDPLNYAVERAWRSGLVVVVSAGNRGPAAGTISKPGDDPLVVTVGAVDDRSTADIGDDALPEFSGRGPTTGDGLAKPDLVAPGARVVSLRAPGSYLEANAPSSWAARDYRRGSGTSMSAAVVSGVTALTLQANPSWTPNRVKHALTATGRMVTGSDRMSLGSGLVDAYAAARAAPPGLANQDADVVSDGTGSLDGSRGNVRVTVPCIGVDGSGSSCALSGERIAPGQPWRTREYTRSRWTPQTWYASQWREWLAGHSWNGHSWNGHSWNGHSWTGTPGTGTPGTAQSGTATGT